MERFCRDDITLFWGYKYKLKRELIRMTRKIKFLHVCTKLTKAMKDSMQFVPMLPGMYNWINVFRGKVMPYKLAMDELEDYDCIQMNMAPVDFPTIMEVKEKLKNSSTMLVLNNDYVAEHWGRLGINPTRYFVIQRMSDMLFGTEPHQVSCMIDRAYCIPHPHRVDILKHYRIDMSEEDKKDKKTKVGTLFHWWEGQAMLQSLLFKKLEMKGYRLTTHIYSFDSRHADSQVWSRLLYDELHKTVEYPKFLKEMMTLGLFVENSMFHTYGRATVDSAALGVPTIGTDRVFSMKHCFPNMCYDPVDMKKGVEIAEKVLKGGKWLEEQMDIAYEKCEFFNYTNSRERFMKAYEESKKRVGK